MPKKKPVEDLMHLLWHGDAHAIERAFKAGIDVNTRDHAGQTPLMEVIIEKRPEFVKLLLDHGADPKAADHEGQTALHFAAHFHQPEAVQQLIDAGAVIDARDMLGRTPLYQAIASYRGERDGDAIWTLLLAGADRKAADTHGVTPEDLAKEPSNYDPGQFFR